jgi:hypothetical protein
MMLDELSAVLNSAETEAKSDDYIGAIVDENALGKPTRAARERSAKRLTELYSLDPSCTLFRLLRHFWTMDQPGRPMLAFLVAAARDPLLRESTPLILETRIGDVAVVDDTAQHLAKKYPKRFSESTGFTTAQRLASSWTQAGYLRGRVKKVRSQPTVTAAVAAFAVLLGYLCGLRGKLLLDSVWTRMLDRSPEEFADLVVQASRHGWLNYKAAGSVVEITFPGLLRPQEEQAAYEQD